MKRKLAEWIVKCRNVILVLMLALAVLCTAMIGKTNINYDLTRYLSGETMTQRALKVMTGEFGSSEQLRVMFVDRTEEEMEGYVDALSALEEVQLASYLPEEAMREQDGHSWHMVTLTLNDCDGTGLVLKLRQMFPEAGTYYVGGGAAGQLDAQESVAREIPMVMLIAVGIVLLVLLLTSHAWLEPVVILSVLAISILINMGTNFIFADVSFITFAVCAILQLALSIDYAIMLLHTWNAGCDSGLSARDAMVDAVAQCLMRIGASAMTTVAGLLSLLFMSFTIGFDIGMVLSKGIVISMLGVFLLMPAVTLLLEKSLRATRHRPLKTGGEHLAAFIRSAKGPLAVVLVLAVICGAWLSSGNTYSFSGESGSEKSESAVINGIFGQSNPLVLLVPGGEEDSDYDKQRDLVRCLEAVTLADGTPAISGITAMVTTGEAALKYYTAREVAEMTGQSLFTVNLLFTLNGFGESVRADRLLAAAASMAAGNEQVRQLQDMLAKARSAFIGPHFGRMLLELNFYPSDAEFNSVMAQILDTVREKYGEDYYITGAAMSNYDIGNAFTGDLLKVNLITLAAILLIVILSFRSVRLPILLVFVIEGAIWITMGISRLLGESIFFMAYLICLAIQMGATIDYGILLCDQYRTARFSGLEKGRAMAETLKKSMPTILTSGTILTTAGFVIGMQCSVYYISSIGLLLSRGSLISALLVLTLLPSLLLISDRWVIRGGKDGPENAPVHEN